MSQQTNMTAVEWLVKTLELDTRFNGIMNDVIEQAKQMEKEQMIEDIIGFQIYLNDEGYITNHDWDFEKEAIYYLHKNKIK